MQDAGYSADLAVPSCMAVPALKAFSAKRPTPGIAIVFLSRCILHPES
jgi:hypothetical protein